MLPQFSSFDSVTVADVTKLIHDAPNKQSWLDPLPMWLLKECSDLLSPFLSALCNMSLRTGVVPASFKTSVITPLIKKSSTDVNTLQNYRPISNLSFVSKLLERLVSTQLRPHPFSASSKSISIQTWSFDRNCTIEGVF